MFKLLWTALLWLTPTTFGYVNWRNSNRDLGAFKNEASNAVSRAREEIKRELSDKKDWIVRQVDSEFQMRRTRDYAELDMLTQRYTENIKALRDQRAEVRDQFRKLNEFKDELAQQIKELTQHMHKPEHIRRDDLERLAKILQEASRS